jgi:phosphoenolpyruvate carboxykinase (ATP)
VLDAWAGTDPTFKMPIRVVTEFAWHNLVARHMFLPENDEAKRRSDRTEFTVIDTPNFTADPSNTARDRTCSSSCTCAGSSC